MSANESGRLQTKMFYHEYRKAVSYAQENADAPIPSFKTLSEWEPVKSTKIDICVRICQHYLSRDDVPDVAFDDGEPIFPPLPPHDAQKPFTQLRKILVYSESPNMTTLIQNVSAN
jgi:hypothetical protein